MAQVFNPPLSSTENLPLNYTIICQWPVEFYLIMLQMTLAANSPLLQRKIRR
jgi:hypothetical protein